MRQDAEKENPTTMPAGVCVCVCLSLLGARLYQTPDPEFFQYIAGPGYIDVQVQIYPSAMEIQEIRYLY
jgi:hypothetical protein